MVMKDNNAQLKQAVQLALDGEWDASHRIVQDYSDDTANWIHAVLHKIEGDKGNSQYWYQNTAGKQYTDYVDPATELKAIAALLDNLG